MAFKYRLNEPLETGTRRIVLEQVDRARRQLSTNKDATAAIHETRKCFKRIRSLLRLARPAISKDAYQTANAQFRDLGRLLAKSRDFDVMGQTLARLQEQRSLSASSVKRVRTAIAKARETSEKSQSVPAVEVALKRLAKARSTVAKINYDRCTMPRLTEGMARDMAGFAHYFAEALEQPDDDAFHEWRKRAQYHRRHMALLAPAWPEALEPRVKLCRHLSEELGLDHDLAVLAEFVAGPKGRPATRRDIDMIQAACRAEQAELRARCTAVGALLTAESAAALRRRIEAYWSVHADYVIDLAIAAE